jgi:hypothetical protein
MLRLRIGLHGEWRDAAGLMAAHALRLDDGQNVLPVSQPRKNPGLRRCVLGENRSIRSTLRSTRILPCRGSIVFRSIVLTREQRTGSHGQYVLCHLDRQYLPNSSKQTRQNSGSGTEKVQGEMSRSSFRGMTIPMSHPIFAVGPRTLVVLAALATNAAAEPTYAIAPQPSPPGHDGGHPATTPIDCPLAKHGMHPADLRPFTDTEKYISYLERPERAKWQKPEAIVAVLGLAGNETVVDVGAGSGYFSFRLARVLPRGTVIANDIEPEMIRHIHHKAMREGVQNLRAVLSEAEDPGIPPEADLVFVCDVLHHVPNQTVWLGRVAREMKPGARLVLVEFKEGKLPLGPPENLKLSRARQIELAKGAGLVLDEEKPKLLPYQTFMVFRKP